MKKYKYSILILLLCAVLALSGCKTVIDRQNVTEPPTEAATEPNADDLSPKSASWFDDAVFVGDSVTLKLSYYCATYPEALGEAAFFCAGSLGYTNALWELDDPVAVHPYYKGEVHLTEDCCEVTGKGHVFIMLGMNDIGLYGPEDAMESCRELISRIMAKSPDARIYIQSVTPMISSAQSDSFNNALVRQFNALLKQYCQDNDYKYLDVYAALADQDGNLPPELCSDPDSMGLHFNDTSCEMWVSYLKNNA